MEKYYEWRKRFLAKNIDPQAAVQELERIEDLYGSLTAETVLEASKPKDALLHSLFTWDDTEAAKCYRAHQARTLINNIDVVIISNGEERKIPVYEVNVGSEGKTYKHIQSVTNEGVFQVKRKAIADLNSLKSKLALYTEFKDVVSKIEDILSTVSTIKDEYNVEITAEV